MTARNWTRPLALVLGVLALVTFWSWEVLALLPAPTEPDDRLRPYVGAAPVANGALGLLIGPWQRFDANRYVAIARAGYTAPNSVFPPLYPALIRSLVPVLAPVMPENTAYFVAARLIAVGALLAALVLLQQLATDELGAQVGRRTITYLVAFPTAFFLLAPYSESLFLLWAIGSLRSARLGRWGLAGSCGLLAVLTRTMGLGLVIPLLYEYIRQQARPFWRGEPTWRVGMVALPAVGFVLFLWMRLAMGFLPLSESYRLHWHQTTLPFVDVAVALRSALLGVGPRAGEIGLYLDLLALLFLLGTTHQVWRELGPFYGLYNVLMVLFALLPHSDLKPLYSLSRYALVFFPSFMVVAKAGARPVVARLYLYASLLLYLYASGQFFIWGWIA